MIDRLERLLNLVIALRETHRPMSAAEIREDVAGYGQSDVTAFRRMFERDKADLRALGVPISTVPLAGWDDRTGYRIDAAAYDLPPVRLSPAELTALAVALQATGLADDAGTGLRKLEVDAALDPAVAPDPDGGYPLREPERWTLEVTLDAPHRAELMEAQLTRTPVRFFYEPMGRPPGERTVDPHAMIHRGGLWYLVGHDHDRDARRAFRLDRMVSEVRSAGQPESFTQPADEISVEDVLPPALKGPERAEVLATPAVAWQVARRALGGGRQVEAERTAFTVTVGDPDIFVAWALEFGPDLEVVDPAELRGRLLDRARLGRDQAAAFAQPGESAGSPAARRSRAGDGAPVSRPRTLERLERILVLVPWLLDHPGAEVDEVTQRFGMSRAELVRDLDVLGYCGLPGYGGGDLIVASIMGDRVSVRLADFFRRPLRLSVREALALLLAARALAAVRGLAESEDLRRAAGKLEAVLGAEPRVAVDLSAPGDEHLPLLRAAVERRRVVRLQYRSRSKQEATERDVDPWAVVGARGAWYLQGWCRLADAPRDFRLDRIVTVDLTEAEAGPLPDQPPRLPAYEPAEGDLEVVLDLSPEAWWLPERYVVDEVRRIGEIQRVRLRTRSLEWVARLALGRAPAIQIVQPPALAERVAVLAEQTLARYQADPGPDL